MFRARARARTRHRPCHLEVMGLSSVQSTARKRLRVWNGMMAYTGFPRVACHKGLMRTTAFSCIPLYK